MNENKFNDILIKYNTQGYNYITLAYSGGGDSGQIDDITLSKTNSMDKIEKDNDIANMELIDENDYEFLDTYCNETILDNYEDWWNNDGGRGTLCICLKTGNYKVLNTIFYQESHDYEHIGSFFK